jgi:hypothetical protein
MPTVHDSGDFSDQGRLWSASGAYFLIGTGDGGVALSPSGEVNLLRNERVVSSVYLRRRTHSTRADALYHLW